MNSKDLQTGVPEGKLKVLGVTRLETIGSRGLKICQWSIENISWSLCCRVTATKENPLVLTPTLHPLGICSLNHLG